MAQHYSTQHVNYEWMIRSCSKKKDWLEIYSESQIRAEGEEYLRNVLYLRLKNSG